LNAPRQSPKISGISWGKISVDGFGAFKDVKLYPGTAREWDWRQTGTRHQPGIQPADVEEILSAGVTEIVLGVGMLGRLGASAETLDLLKDRGVTVHIVKSEAAVRRYNEIRERARVGALIHSTC
jgi:hypothetical protein